jgi:hypothetical protein
MPLIMQVSTSLCDLSLKSKYSSESIARLWHICTLLWQVCVDRKVQIADRGLLTHVCEVRNGVSELCQSWWMWCRLVSTAPTYPAVITETAACCCRPAVCTSTLCIISRVRMPASYSSCLHSALWDGHESNLPSVKVGFFSTRIRTSLKEQNFNTRLIR